MKGEVDEVGLSYWYSGERLEALLRTYTNTHDTKVLSACNTIDQLQHSLTDQILNPSNQVLNPLNDNLEEKHSVLHYIVPLNVNALTGELGVDTNHWVGLYITNNITRNHNTNENGNVTEHVSNYEICYVDPMGRNINSSVEQVILSKFNIEGVKEPLLNKGIQYVTQVSTIEISGNTDDCGPFLIYCMACLNHNMSIPQVKSHEESKELGAFLRQSFDKGLSFDTINAITPDLFIIPDLASNDTQEEDNQFESSAYSSPADDLNILLDEMMDKDSLASASNPFYLEEVLEGNSIQSLESKLQEGKLRMQEVISLKDTPDEAKVAALKKLELELYKPLIHQLAYKKGTQELKALVVVLDDLGYLHTKQGELSGDVKYYTDAAIFYNYVISIINENQNLKKDQTMLQELKQNITDPYKKLNNIQNKLIEAITSNSKSNNKAHKYNKENLQKENLQTELNEINSYQDLEKVSHKNVLITLREKTKEDIEKIKKYWSI